MSLNNGGVVYWSQTANDNATADNTVGWSEGQAPSTINDSARAMMASVAKYRDDIAGAIVTGGTSAAYTVSSNQDFVSLSALSGQVIAFTPNATNTAGSPSVTLDVDGLGAKVLRSSPNTELLPGVLIQGTPYLATYNSADGAFYLQGFYGASPYLIPLGGMLDFVGTTAPNSNFVLPFGQAISRTTYSALFAMVSTTFGSGDGSTTFNVPDLRGRVVAGLDNMGGSAASRITNSGTGNSGINGASLGATGGSQTEVLLTANLPPYTPAGSVSSSSSTSQQGLSGNSGGGFSSGGSFPSPTALTISTSSSFTGTAQGGTSTPVVTMPPIIMANKILRVI